MNLKVSKQSNTGLNTEFVNMDSGISHWSMQYGRLKMEIQIIKIIKQLT